MHYISSGASIHAWFVGWESASIAPVGIKPGWGAEQGTSRKNPGLGSRPGFAAIWLDDFEKTTQPL